MVFIFNSIPEVNLYIRVKKGSVDWFKWFDNVHSESFVETEFSPKVIMSKIGVRVQKHSKQKICIFHSRIV